MLFFVGIGIGDEKDITVRGLECIRKADLVYLEAYTSFLQTSLENLEKFYGKKVQALYRADLEQGSKKILQEAQNKSVVLLIIGDVFCATTHTSLVLECKEKHIPFEIIHNASIFNYLGDTGLSLYHFGKITSFPFYHQDVLTPYETLEQNSSLHTLVLLDLDPQQKRFMHVHEALRYFLDKEEEHKKNIFSVERLVVACCGLGSKNQIISFGTAQEILSKEYTVYPQSLIIPGTLHFIEEEALGFFRD